MNAYINKKELIKTFEPKYILQVMILAILYFISGEISFSISKENSIVTIVIFMAEGFALTGVLLFGKKLWVGIFIGQLLLALTSMPILPSISIAIVNSVEAILAVIIFNYFNFDKTLKNTRDLFGLILLIVFVLQPFSSLLGNTILNLFDISPIFSNMSLFSWWFGNIMGQILLVPTLLFLYSRFEETNIVIYLLIGLFFAVISYIFQVLVPIQNVSLLLSITLPLIIYISARKGIQYATFSVLVITMVTLSLTYYNMGIFTYDTEINNLINLNFYFLSQMLLLLIIGILFDEREQREQHLEIIIADEVKKNDKQTLMLLQQSRLAQMGQILNMVAHQWRQPLNTLQLLSELLVFKYHNNKIEKKDIDKFQRETRLQIKQMSNTINNFSNFFSPRKDKSRFLLNDTISYLDSIMRPIFDSHNIILICNQTEDIYIYGYPNEFAQALLNIIYNAKDALVEKVVQNRKVSIEIKEEKDSITINICDNAGGIDSSVIQKIFEPYFSNKKEKNGTGLGLYMSKIIIEKHMNGLLSVYNSKDGACFNIKIDIKNSI